MKGRKRYFRQLILLMALVQSASTFAQDQFVKATALPSNVQPAFYQLTAQDRLNYILSVGAPIKIKRDTFVYKFTPDRDHVYQQKQDQMIIPVTFTNMSNDTLEYIGMDCSWWDIYLTNDPQIEIEPPADMLCYKNGLTIIKIAPKNSTVVNMPIGYAENLGKDKKFRVGMIVQKIQVSCLRYLHQEIAIQFGPTRSPSLNYLELFPYNISIFKTKYLTLPSHERRYYRNYDHY